MINVHQQLRSPIQSGMTFLDCYGAIFDKPRLMIGVCFQPRHSSKATNEPPKCMYPSQQHYEFCHLLYANHVFFNFDSVDAVHTASHLSSHFKFRCRQLIPPGLWKYMNPFLLGMCRPPADSLELSAPCQPSAGAR